MNKMGETIFLGRTRKTGSDLDHVRVLLRGSEKIDSKLHGWDTGLPPFMGGSPKEMLAGSFAFAGSGKSFGDLLDRHIGSPPFSKPCA